MSKAEPMSATERLSIYTRNRREGNRGSWALTPAQRRRLEHKLNKLRKAT